MKFHGAKSISFALALFAAGDVLGVHDTGGYRVAYLVSGTAREASVTYVNAEGGTEQKEIVIPLHNHRWSTMADTFRPGAFVSISAQNKGDQGTIVVTIIVDGKNVRRSESEGAYVIASAHFTLPH